MLLCLVLLGVELAEDKARDLALFKRELRHTGFAKKTTTFEFLYFEADFGLGDIVLVRPGDDSKTEPQAGRGKDTLVDVFRPY